MRPAPQCTAEGTPLVPILADLTLYTHTDLAHTAFQLLASQFSARRTFLSSLKNLQLLVDVESVRTYRELQVMVGQLRDLTENAEIWMQLHVDTHIARLRTAELVLKSMTALCSRCVCGSVLMV